ncbi:elongation of very long chain fatty acids protein 7-like [Thrips palmi]|uniref:Elongation of very long chain fatty acids protein n=1 Tax=Thrips palmi TaxID=161013 RepID=A0A6P8YWM2_THRPL|nr:elongation of very long chain fatty acids protein 7-like [Thrips palmi]
MAAVTRAAYEVAAKMADDLWNYCDPRSCNLPLATNPLHLAAILGVYLYFVLSLGPRLMKNRPPFELRTIMLVYNGVQVVWCGYLFYECIRLAWGWKYSYICEPLSMEMEPYDFEVARTVWLYFILKIVDLLDTVFMVLRKNHRQISFLHVYHHSGMVFCIWMGTKAFPGGHHTFLGFINCFVHCLLYGYYFLSLYNPKIKVAWWKKYITVVQIVQFAMNVAHESLPLLMPNCEVNKVISGALVIQNLFMFVLFTDFYLKNYSDKAIARKTAAVAKES